jgi:hypothetical protein
MLEGFDSRFPDPESADGWSADDGIFRSGSRQLMQKLASADGISVPHLWQNIWLSFRLNYMFFKFIGRDRYNFTGYLQLRYLVVVFLLNIATETSGLFKRL